MKKLATLRSALLAAPFGVKPSALLTAAEGGAIRANRGTRNGHLELTYTAHIIVTDWTGDPRTLLWWVTDWLHTASPAAEPDAIRFETDIIDHARADIELRIDLTETVRATVTAAGVQIDQEPDPDAQAINMAALFPDMPADSHD